MHSIRLNFSIQIEDIDMVHKKIWRTRLIAFRSTVLNEIKTELSISNNECIIKQAIRRKQKAAVHI